MQNGFVNVRIENDTLLCMLCDRVRFWEHSLDDEEISLYDLCFENYIKEGLFEGVEFDCLKIVDNIIHNNTKIIDKRDFKGDSSEILAESKNYVLLSAN